MKNRNKLLSAAIWAFLALILASTATYAWFTFAPNTEIDTLNGQMTEGKVNYITEIVENKLPDALNFEISNDNVEFSTDTQLLISADFKKLKPISTADLNRFYSAISHNKKGISNKFSDVTGEIDSITMHGTVYLRSLASAADAYVDLNNISLTGDSQALAAARLGLRITKGEETVNYIFRLDKEVNQNYVDSRRTITNGGTIVSSVDSNGNADFVVDSSVSLEKYSTPEFPLITIPANDTVKVEYFIYLEGCDDNCSNAVMQKEISISLAFAAQPNNS